MSKKLIILLLILLSIFILIIVATTIFLSRQSSTIKSPVAENNQSVAKQIQLSATNKEYIDPSGFKFNYPDNLTIATQTNPDDTTYANLKILDENKSVLLSLKVTDSDQSQYELLTENKKTTKIKLDDIEAVQFTDNNMLTAAALDQEVLFLFTTNIAKNKDVKSKLLSTVIDSFKFVRPATSEDQSLPADTSGGEIIDEGEEIIE